MQYKFEKIDDQLYVIDCKDCSFKVDNFLIYGKSSLYLQYVGERFFRNDIDRIVAIKNYKLRLKIDRQDIFILLCNSEHPEIELIEKVESFNCQIYEQVLEMYKQDGNKFNESNIEQN